MRYPDPRGKRSTWVSRKTGQLLAGGSEDQGGKWMSLGKLRTGKAKASQDSNREAGRTALK